MSAEPVPVGDLSTLDASILKTVRYASLFECALSTERLHRMLWDVPLSRALLEERLRGAPLSAHLGMTDGHVHPPGCAHWVMLRRERTERSRELVERHRRALDLISGLPFVRLLGLTGGCAHDNATDDDLDVFLVARRGRAWSLTLAVILLSRLLRCRRTLCVNYVVDEEGSALPEQDAFTAAEVAGMQPWAGGPGYRAFLGANAWVARYLPNFIEAAPRESARVPAAGGPRWLERVLDFGLAPVVEASARALLGAHFRLKWRGQRPGVALSPSRLKLHAVDHATQVRARFARVLRSEGLS